MVRMIRAYMVQTAIMIVALFVLSASAEAGRVVSFDVLVDGKVVLSAHRLDQGDGFDTAWNYLKTLPLKNPADGFVVSDAEKVRLQKFMDELNKQGPTKATLKGKCRIFCRYAGDVTVDELRLVRKDAQSPWQLDPAQVDELAKKRTIDKQMRTREQLDEAK